MHPRCSGHKGSGGSRVASSHLWVLLNNGARKCKSKRPSFPERSLTWFLRWAPSRWSFCRSRRLRRSCAAESAPRAIASPPPISSAGRWNHPTHFRRTTPPQTRPHRHLQVKTGIRRHRLRHVTTTGFGADGGFDRFGGTRTWLCGDHCLDDRMPGTRREILLSARQSKPHPPIRRVPDST